MKKIILTTGISIALISSSVYAAGPATSGFVLSGEGSYSMISKQYDGPTNIYTDTGQATVLQGKSSATTGFGIGGYAGYDYAITDYVTIGAKIGYFHSFGIGKATLTNADGQSINLKETSNNIPFLLNIKYYFNSGFFLGGETGINFQKYCSKETGNLATPNTTNSHWNPQYVIGGLIGYQITPNISIDSSMDYMAGKNLIGDSQSNGIKSKDDALANIKLGIAINYKLPM